MLFDSILSSRLPVRAVHAPSVRHALFGLGWPDVPGADLLNGGGGVFGEVERIKVSGGISSSKGVGMKQLTGVYPISGEDLSALPVKAIGPAVEFYRTVLGFSVVSQDDGRATVQRDDARLGLVANPGHKPEKAGSCAFSVADLDGLRTELDGRGLDLGIIDTQEWSGKQYRVFFLREAENGYCYCFSQRVAER
jgi:Glyoxalase/Bleomycin resistance protein/Dioxygenase superfamily